MISRIYYTKESHKSDLEKKFFFADVIAQYQFRFARARAYIKIENDRVRAV